jgi:hypothetical protein
MNERGAIIVGTAVLPLVAVVVCFIGSHKNLETHAIYEGLAVCSI